MLWLDGLIHTPFITFHIYTNAQIKPQNLNLFETNDTQVESLDDVRIDIDSIDIASKDRLTIIVLHHYGYRLPVEICGGRFRFQRHLTINVV